VPWVGLYDSPTGDETEMALNLIKLCVGVSEVEEMDSWVKLALGGHDSLDHVTRMFPKRRDEILPDGSLYWVMRGMIMCRQPIADLEAVTGGDGIQRCRIVFKPEIIRVRPTPRRAFQGWRYFEAADVPPDLKKGEASAANMPEEMQRELAALGLI
jgi:hypothetical protein